MAFNPFNWFRKHAKIGFAILTIVCMFTFVLSSGMGGGADVFDTIARWMGGGRNRGKDVTTLYDKTVVQRDLDELGDHRFMASDFILNAMADAQLDTSRELGTKMEQLKKREQAASELDRELSAEFEFYAVSRFIRMSRGGRAMREYNAGKTIEESLTEAKLLQQIQFQLQFGMQINPGMRAYVQRKPEEMYRDIFREQERLVQLRTKLKTANRTSELKLVDGMLLQLSLDAWLLNPDRTDGEFLFGGAPNTDGYLDFMVWQHQADTLGITIAPEDACKEVNRLVGKEILTGDAAKDKEYLSSKKIKGRNGRDLEVKELYKALCEEVRVALAYTTLMGHGPGIKAYDEGVFTIHTSAVTPGDFYDYFREQRTAMDLLVVPVPVSSVLALSQQNPKEEELKKAFSPEVTAAILKLAANKPTDKELSSLFELYKKNEPEPWSERPAFKQPRRVLVEWIQIPEEPDPNYIKLASLANTGLFPAPDAWVNVFSLVEAEDRDKKLARSVTADYPTPSLAEGDPGLAYITSVITPQGVAVNVLSGARIPEGLGAALAPLVTAQARRKDVQPFVTKDRDRRSEAIASLLVDGLSKAATGAPWALTAMMAIPDDATKWTIRYYTGLDTPMPFVSPDALAEQIAARQNFQLATQLFYANLGELLKDLDKAQKEIQKDPKQGEKVVQESLKKYAFTKYYGSSTRLLDQYAIGKDTAMKPLHDDYNKSRTGQDALTEDRFASLFFNNYPTYEFPGRQAVLQRHVYWKKEDVAASEPTTLDDPKHPQTRKQVEEAWRIREARKVAKQIADEIQQKLSKKAQEANLSGQVAELRAKITKEMNDEESKKKEELRVPQPYLQDVIDGRCNLEAEKLVQLFFDKELAALTKTYEPLKFTLGAPFPLLNVANRVRPEFAVPGPISYTAWKAPEDKMPYPVAYFISTLLKVNQGQVVVLPDRPVENYYVVAQLLKKEPTVEKMLREHGQAASSGSFDATWIQFERSFGVQSVPAAGDMADPIWRNFVEERYKKTRKEVIDRLRQEAGAVDARGRFKLNEGMRKDDTVVAGNDDR